ncbi:MAG: hypothetical protein N2Z75_06695 [Meiothermus sp.]|nr:hypothetical protein [Meiothermus sp.]
MRWSFAVFLMILSGCASAPLAIGVRDFDADFTGVQTGQAVFVKAQFDKPPVPVAQLTLEGSLNFQQTSASFTFFASDSEPCNNRVSGFYICNPNAPHIEQSGTVNFSSGTTQPLRLSGNRLKSGINSGNLWLGVRLDSGGVASGTLQFRNLVARVAFVP